MKLKALLKTVSTGVLLGSAVNASAAVISFSNVAALDGSGLTSEFIDPTNASSGQGASGFNGYFIETFDLGTAMAGFSRIGSPGAFIDQGYNGTPAADCGLNSLNAGIEIDTSINGFQISSASGTGRAAPANDNTCFGYTPASGQGVSVTNPAWLEIDYINFLTNGAKIDYLGFYWGSIDTWNDFVFYDDDDNVLLTITGSSLLANCSPGSQSSACSNRYVNIDFEQNEAFSKFRVISTAVAGEFDNIVVGLNTRSVSEPATVMVLGMGLIGLAVRRRRFFN